MTMESAMKNVSAESTIRRPSRQVLADLPIRTIQFLRAAGGHVGVREALVRGGYGSRDHSLGWRLLQAVCSAEVDSDNSPASIDHDPFLSNDSAVTTSACSVRHVASLALYEWLARWSTIARSVIKRRDWLIALGLATRRRRGGNGPT